MLRSLLRFVPARWRKSPALIHVIRLEGPITSGRALGSPVLNAKALEPTLKKAFRKGVAGVVLAINCPGGSPVQSAMIARRIRSLAVEHNIPVYAFCEDVAASGGYWLACAADEIYADENSIVGSIGVISAGFGLQDAIAKLGIERRVHTAGENKNQNDPFSPEKAEDVARLETLLTEMHGSFKALVRDRRKGRLKGDEKELFSGLFWRGEKALDLGLIDGLGHVNDVMTRKFGEKVDIKPILASQGWGLRRIGMSQTSDLPEAALQALETRALWSRFGL